MNRYYESKRSNLTSYKRRNINFKVITRSLLLSMIVIPLILPLTLNAQAISEDVQTNNEYNDNINNAKKETKTSKFAIFNKEDFTKDSKSGDYKTDINVSEDFTVDFDYSLKDNSSLYWSEIAINIDNNIYNLDQSVPLEKGQHEISMTKESYDSLEEINVETEDTPELKIDYNDSNLDLSVENTLTENMDFFVEMTLPKNISVNKSEITDGGIEVNSNDVKIDFTNNKESKRLPLEIDSEKDMSAITYDYLYSLNGEDFYENESSIAFTGNSEELNYISTPTNQLSLNKGEEVGDNKKIESKEELLDLFEVEVPEDSYDKLEVEGIEFPISTKDEQDYDFIVNYEGTDLSKQLKLNVEEFDGIAPFEPSDYAKNTAYGKTDSNNDQATGVIDVEEILALLGVEYKINAITHELILHIKLNQDILTGTEAFTVEVKDGKETATFSEDDLVDISTAAGGVYEYELKTGSLEDLGFARDGEYSITFMNEGEPIKFYDDAGSVQSEVKIAVPKTLMYDNGTTDTTDDILYGLIGDNINVDTDVTKVSDMDQSTPANVTNYGIYELESIMYEEANGEDVDSDATTPKETDWTEDDLTLSKYDHVIRPNNSNYLVASNIDGSATSTSTTYDKDGGWTTSDSTGDLNDGFRPIGQIIADKTAAEYFTGQITGNVDLICGASNCTDNTGTAIDHSDLDNTIISNMYIDTSYYFAGMISGATEAKVDNLGMIDPQINGTGGSYSKPSGVGSFAGYAEEGTEFLNLYVYANDGSSYLSTSSTNLGGIVGLLQDSTVTSDGEFSGVIPGVTFNDSLTQPNDIEPDKDGYKTFTIIDIDSTYNYEGGIVGQMYQDSTKYTGKLSNLYSKSNMLGNANDVGGIVGSAIYKSGAAIEINNSYYIGSIEGGSQLGGIAGLLGGQTPISVEVPNSFSGESKIIVSNTYTRGSVTGTGKKISGIAGNAYDQNIMIDINNNYSTMTIEGMDNIAGIANTESPGVMKINNNMYLGTLKINEETVGDDRNFVGGVISNPPSDNTWSEPSTGTLQMRNNFTSVIVEDTGAASNHGGPIAAYLDEDAIIPDPELDVIPIVPDVANNYTSIRSRYKLNGTEEDFPQDGKVSTSWPDEIEVTPTYVEDAEVNDAAFWTDSLKFDTNNWNIVTGNATVPSPDVDTADESQDNGDGQITDVRKFYPHIKEVNSDGTATTGEVLEQINVGLPEAKDYIIDESTDYKINSQTLDLQIKLNVDPTVVADDTLTGTVIISDDSGEVLTSSFTPIPGEQVISVENTSGAISQDTTYSILVKVRGTGQDKTTFKIHTPKQIVSGSKTYSLIGDETNALTDIEDAFSSDKIEPGDGSDTSESSTPTTNKYGIYELESIGYEEANSPSWDEEDLTLAKYDHVIRPLDGNYLLATDVDATQTSEGTGADNIGGFDADGYRPIGQKINKGADDEDVPFTGEITGDVDTLLSSDKDNTIISNLFIDTDQKNVGLVGLGNEVDINNLGIVDPSIKGYSNVGAFAGSLTDIDKANEEVNKLTNLYAIESEYAEGTINVEGASDGTSASGAAVGSIVGSAINTDITSDGLFTGSVPGDLSSDIQPSMTSPDKDGYKTFSNLNIKSTTGSIYKGIGGIVGYGSGINIDKVYNKGNIEGTGGGIVGASTGGNIINAYNKGNVDSTVSSNANAPAGGIVGTADKKLLSISNVINEGQIRGQDSVGGIVGYASLRNAGTKVTIKNSLNYGNVYKEKPAATAQAGGVLGAVGLVEGAQPVVTINSVINFGDIATYNSDPESIDPLSSSSTGGIIGGLEDGGQATATIKNTLNVGPSYYAIGDLSSTATVSNNYQIDSIDYTSSENGNDVIAFDLLTVDWWKNTTVGSGLGLDDNWNIDSSDAKVPSPDSDSTDESSDNNLGQINREFYPHIKEVNQDGTTSDLEVLEQTDITLEAPTIDYIVDGSIDYKINAQNLDIQTKVEIENTYDEELSELVTISDESGSEIVTASTSGKFTGNQVITVENPGWTHGNIAAGAIQPDTTYTVKVELTGRGNDTESFKIHTPKQVVYDSKTYALVGDGINVPTDAEDLLPSDAIEPGNGSNLPSDTITTENYGIYELESIGYEEANGTDTDDNVETINTTDWSEEDLTLAKYDHVIRPLDGKYVVASNVDATVTKTNQKADKVGGFSTDGYRPIGQVIGTEKGYDTHPFTGEITGDVDKILGESVENTYINDLYIYEPVIGYVGLVSFGVDAEINNLGMIDPNIEASFFVAPFIGAIMDDDLEADEGSKLINVYSLETVDDSGDVNYEIKADAYGSGLVGGVNDTEIKSDGNFSGSIPGAEGLSSDLQPSNFPDKDGYKTFNTVDVSSGMFGGGIVAQLAYADISNIYNKGTVYGRPDTTQGIGGIAGHALSNNMTNVYNTGDIIGQKDAGGIIGQNFSGSGPGSIINAYNTGYVQAGRAGGIIGSNEGCDIENAINTGEIYAEEYEVYYPNVGGILGNASNYIEGSKIIDPKENLTSVNIDIDRTNNYDSRASRAVNIHNVINIGDITVASDSAYVGGISGTAVMKLDNAINTGKISTSSDYSSITLGPFENVYSLESNNDPDLDLSNGVTGFSYVSTDDLLRESWWKDELFQGVAADYNNFNISAGDASAPDSDADPSDESSTASEGNVNNGFYPTVKEVGGTTILDTEVPEQGEFSIDVTKSEEEIEAKNDLKEDVEELDESEIQTVDAGQIQKDSDLKGNVNSQSEEAQDEMIIDEDETISVDLGDESTQEEQAQTPLQNNQPLIRLSL